MILPIQTPVTCTLRSSLPKTVRECVVIVQALNRWQLSSNLCRLDCYLDDLEFRFNNREKLFPVLRHGVKTYEFYRVGTQNFIRVDVT